MKRPDPAATTTSATIDPTPIAKSNGQRDVPADVSFGDLGVILASLQTMRDGDFSVRLPGNWTGLQ